MISNTSSSNTISRSRSFWLNTALIGLLCALAASAITVILNKKIEQLDQQYGQALANMAARRAIQSAINLDLVSLQVILQEITENPSVISATIHDVENKLMVQAAGVKQNDRRQSASRQRNFTAPINVHDNIAGYVTVSVDFRTENFHSKLYGVFALLALGLLGLNVALRKSAEHLDNTRDRDDEDKTEEKKPAIKPPAHTLPIIDKFPSHEEKAESPTPTARELDKKNPRIELIIRFQNLRTLYGQLNHRSFRSVIQKIEIQLRDLMALYAGELTSINADCARITFRSVTMHSHDNNSETQTINAAISEATFNAICSAHLISTINQKPANVHLALNCLIVKREPDTSTLKHLGFNLFKQDTEHDILKESHDGDVLIDTELLAKTHTPCLADRIEYEIENTPNNVAKVTKIKEPYCSLLNKQLAQLQNY